MTARRAIPVFLLVLFCLLATSGFGQVVINEVDYDQNSTDTAEFLELKNVGGAPVNLDNYTVQLVNGNAGGSAVYDTIDLPNVNLAAGDYYVICANNATVINCDLDDGPDTNFIQNGNPDAIGLRLSGVLVDAVSYGGATGAPYTETTGTVATDSTAAFIGLSRFPDGADTNNNNADFSLRCITPGTANLAANSSCVAPNPLPSLTVTDVTQAETDAGTTTFTFQVNLSAPAGTGGVTFDIATADGTAQDDNPVAEDNDYVAQSLTGQTIAAGNSSFAFNVTVNGDVDVEADETFFVNVTNVTGATVTDGQGQGTIQNDDVACASLNVNDVSQNETNAGTTTFAFTVSLSGGGCGTVTFDIATADGTAQDDNPATEDFDYVPQSLTGQTVTFASPYTFNVTVNGDTTLEPNETFFVNITNVSPGNVQVSDPQGLGTIVNDDYTRIHAIQGPGNASPIVGSVVTTRGVVTGVKSNGFFIQEPDASVDADPATSEGIFVFTSTAPPPAAAVGNYVEVTGTVTEFSPSQDPLQPPLTELTFVTVTAVPGPPPALPAPIPLTPTFPNPAGPYDQLERVEGMRVSVASFTVSAPTDGDVNETAATSASTGVFWGTVTGVARPFREPGIQAPDPPPSTGGTIPPIPRWDTNPETLRVDSNGLVGAPILDVSTGATVTGLVGPLDYGFRRYTILPDPPPSPAPVVTGGKTATSATPMTGREFTVAAYNLERFYDDVNNPSIGEPVLTSAAFDRRLAKASLGIRNHLGTPDVVGMVEVEDLPALQALAARINADAVAASQPDPQYVAHLVEGNDPGWIDVGFLVKTAPVAGATPRVTVNAVVQELDGSLLVNPDSSTSTLHDRPPLRLDAVINDPNGATFPVQVIVVHQRSLNDVESEAAGPNGWPTVGARVRMKRQKQAEDLANLIQTRQTANPTENMIILGDFNAFEFNDGYVDAMNVTQGTPPPDNTTAVPGDGVDLVNPDLDNLVDTPPPSERYSYLFDGQAQNLDHLLVNQALINATVNRRIEHPRINADFPEIDRNDPNIARRLSDHDPLVGFFEVLGFASADVSVTKTDNVDPINAGQNFFYTITVTNAGADAAENVSWSDALPAGTTFVSLSQPGGWTCTTPAVGANGTVTCSIASLGVTSAAFNLTVASNAGLTSGSTLSNTVNVATSTADPNTANNTDTETTTVATSADLLLSKTDSPDPVTAGNNVSYQITITNNGPSNAANASFSDTLPTGTTFVSLSTTGPWTCTTPAVGAPGTITCSNTSFGVTVDFFTIVVKVDSNVAAGTVLSNTATITSATTDPNGANNSDTATTTVVTSADLLVTKTDSPDPVTAGTNLTYSIAVTNVGPSDAVSVSLSDTVPFGTTFVSFTQPGGWTCTTPPGVGYVGPVNCSIATFPAGGVANFTLVVELDPSLADGFVISNTATVSTTTTDPTPGNNSDTETTTVGSGSADLEMRKDDAPISSDTVLAGQDVLYTIIIRNNGPSNANNLVWTDTIPAGTTFQSLNGGCSVCPLPDGWTCATPPVGGTGTISCSGTSLAVTFPASPAIFTLVLNVDPSLANGTVLSNTATVSAATPDPNTANNTDTETTTVLTSADVQVTKADAPDPATAGTNLTYTITVTNAGPSDASTVALGDTVPAGTTFVSLAAPAGWTCSTPAVGGTGAVNCSIATLPAGSIANFTLVVAADAALTSGTIITNTATVSTSTTDPNAANNTDTEATTVGVGSADLSVTKTDSPDPVNAGANITYTITVNNAGPTNAASVTLSDTLPANTTFVSLTPAAGWTCITPAVGATGTVTCTNPNVAPGSAAFTLVVRVTQGTPSGTVITNTATVSSTTADPNTGNESDTETTAVLSPANVTGTKTASGTFLPGGALTYTIVLTNSGPSTQQDNPGNELIDILPPQLTLVSATATSGTAVATVATNTVTWNGSIAPSASVTITITATINATVTPGTTITNQGTINYDADGNGTNESTRPTDNPAAPGASDPTAIVIAPASHEQIPTLDEYALMGLALMLAMLAVMVMKK